MRETYENVTNRRKNVGNFVSSLFCEAATDEAIAISETSGYIAPFFVSLIILCILCCSCVHTFWKDLFVIFYC